MKRRPPISRRTFLKLTATAAAAAALAGCVPEPKSSSETNATHTTNTIAPGTPESLSPEATLTPEPSQTATEAPTSTTTQTPTPTPAYMAVVHGPDPATITRAAIEALGGMAGFMAAGDDVIIKPNICTNNNPPEYASTTNPTVVATLVSMCLEAGAKRVRVMDFPILGQTEAAYDMSGIKTAVEAAGGTMQVMSYPKYISAEIPMGRSMNEIRIYPDILETDLLINVPIAKHHSLARLTLGCKNLMGVVLDRNLMHADLHQRIADLTSLVRPKLTVMDAVRILTNHGPTGGDLADVKQMDTVIASRDVVAVDAYSTTLFGLTAADIGYIMDAADMGLGTTDLSSIDMREISLG